MHALIITEEPTDQNIEAVDLAEFAKIAKIVEAEAQTDGGASPRGTGPAATSVRHEHIALSAGKLFRHRQRARLVGLHGNLLCQHDIACDEITFGDKAPTNTRTAGAVELVDVHRGAAANPVSLSAVAACDLKIAFRVILRELLRR
jgi:hypothetical protein